MLPEPPPLTSPEPGTQHCSPAPHSSATAPRHEGLPGADSVPPVPQPSQPPPRPQHWQPAEAARGPGLDVPLPADHWMPQGEGSDWAGQYRGCARCWGCLGNHTGCCSPPTSALCGTLGHATSHWTGVRLGGYVPGEPSSAGRRGGCSGLKITRSSPLTGRVQGSGPEQGPPACPHAGSSPNQPLGRG